VRSQVTSQSPDAERLGYARVWRYATSFKELLRAGLHALVALDDAKLAAVLAELAPLKAGRPKKER
jgi:hypothetical protein